MVTLKLLILDLLTRQIYILVTTELSHMYCLQQSWASHKICIAFYIHSPALDSLQCFWNRTGLAQHASTNHSVCSQLGADNDSIVAKVS